MGDADSTTLLPPSSGTFTPGTPSGLTPNTRSEAEAAFTYNTTTQTESAAPTTPLPSRENMPFDKTIDEEKMNEAQKAWRKPAGLIRTSSTNYEQALKEAHKEPSLSSVLSSDTVTESGRDVTGETVASPTSMATSAFPPPGQGVVPIHTGVGTGQAEAIKRAKPSGLSLGALGRQQSWSAQDFKHVYSANLMEPVKSDAGYASEVEERDADR
ncbi:hypothetical protein K505DRAFT_69966 [Melanomma pulvis-pyrius CBS 109.77]|uniref:Uncharacterized protein n=1 Tax=Melanomma pulvis-pyrius CBS 109.77 TaxID=1314802 RepID=A0A6A6XX35_9PLEO|nr:hypothetical protein K505DRAFT_69966 [Melanomma pulvis-pyrius CBS 109.77]